MNKTAPINCLHSAIWAVDQFSVNPRNPNYHPSEQLAILAKVIEVNGWRSPIVVSTRSNLVVKGHGRLAAAKLAGFTHAPVELQDYDSDAAELADLIADNRISELSEMDQFALNDIIVQMKLDADFENFSTGFTDEEMDGIAVSVLDARGELTDGVMISQGNKPQSARDTYFNIGAIRFPISREVYLKWQDEIWQSVGFTKKSIIEEIRRRLSL